MSKKIIAIFLLALAFFAYCYGYTTVKHYKPEYGYVTANTNFRTNPSLSSKIHKVLPKNTNIKIVGEFNYYYIIQTNDNMVGCVSKKYVKKSSSRKPTKASTYTNLRYSSLYTSKSGNVNIRSGPSTSFTKISTMNEKDSVKIIGKIKNFYLIITKKNNIGMVREDLLRTVSSKPSTPSVPSTPPSSSGDMVLITGSANEQEVLTLINNARVKKGLSKLKLSKRLTEMARLKSNDMVKNNYFGHESKVYGSPFKMLKDFGIDYKEAGENIAGNPSIKDAVNSWLASPTHAENIYSKGYNYIGIGVSKSSTYGYIITAMFIGK